MSNPARTVASSGLCDVPPAPEQGRNQPSSINFAPSGDYEESEMWKRIMKEMGKQKEAMKEEFDKNLNQKLKEQKVELERLYDGKFAEQERKHQEELNRVKQEMEQESDQKQKQLEDNLGKQIEDFKALIPDPDDPNIIFRKLGGETSHFSFINSLTEGVEKILNEKIKALESRKEELKEDVDPELEKKLEIINQALRDYEKWIEEGKSARYKKMAARAGAGGGAGLVIGGAATAAVHAALLIGSKAALAKAGVAGLSIGIAAGPACWIVFGCLGAGIVVVLIGYGIWWGYRKYKKSKALKQPNRDDLIKQLAESFIFRAKAKIDGENEMAEIVDDLAQITAALNPNFEADDLHASDV